AKSLLINIYNYFFSSRRWHTRWPRNWSSDVCSSDLLPLLTRSRSLSPNAWGSKYLIDVGPSGVSTSRLGPPCSHKSWRQRPHGRSEERRVGAETPTRWSSAEIKKHRVKLHTAIRGDT